MYTPPKTGSDLAVISLSPTPKGIDLRPSKIISRIIYSSRELDTVIIAGAVADFTGHVDVGQEVHFDADDAVALAGFTAAALDVEAEAAGLVAPDLGFRRLAVELADGIEDARIRRRVGPRRPTDGRLVDVDDLIDVFDPFEGLEFPRPVGRAVDGFGHGLIEDFIDQGRLARPGNAGDDGQGPEGDGNVDILQIVFGCADDLDGRTVAFSPFFRDGNIFRPLQILAGQGLGAGHDVFGRPLGDDGAAVFPRFRADIDDVVGSPHGVVIVFDDDEGIAQIAQVAQGVEEAVIVPLMEADRRFIEDVEDADQARSDLSGQADSLGFAAG